MKAEPAPPREEPSPPGRAVIAGWRRDERTRDIPQSPLRARLVSQAYHSHPGRTAPHAPSASTHSLRMPAEQVPLLTSVAHGLVQVHGSTYEFVLSLLTEARVQ
ncbi:MAG TPA: hypothetical protein VF844_20065 [Ktedonobacteraceae bacterium]